MVFLFSCLASKIERIPIGIMSYKMSMILKILSFVLNRSTPMKSFFRISILNRSSKLFHSEYANLEKSISRFWLNMYHRFDSSLLPKDNIPNMLTQLIDHTTSLSDHARLLERVMIIEDHLKIANLCLFSVFEKCVQLWRMEL